MLLITVIDVSIVCLINLAAADAVNDSVVRGCSACCQWFTSRMCKNNVSRFALRLITAPQTTCAARQAQTSLHVFMIILTL